MTDNARVERIRAQLQQALAPTILEIEDDSASHAGHVGAQGGGGHFNVTIASAAFIDQSPLQRHRMVHDALRDLLKTDIHALSIKALLP